ncbi:MAG TPA: ABC transporter ATP-binding protein [Saprospiraceae bacterium]|nr:ABC transporter ATP-binding protein [Saprospiraceae bacterium]
MLSIYNVSKYFGKLLALNALELQFDNSKVYALIGPNGSGKTTLIKCILGLVLPTQGEIILDGQPVLNRWQYREKIGYMPQVGRYPENLTIGQLFSMMKDVRKHPGPLDTELYDAFQMEEMKKKPMHTLSGGTRQKVSAALAFLFDTPVLILDEPTAGLDPVASETLKGKILKEKSKGKLIIITSHILSDLDGMVSDLTYLYEGSAVFHDSIEVLNEKTREEKLSKAIIRLIEKIQQP